MQKGVQFNQTKAELAMKRKEIEEEEEEERNRADLDISWLEVDEEVIPDHKPN